jgi:hypothetical protein
MAALFVFEDESADITVDFCGTSATEVPTFPFRAIAMASNSDNLCVNAR